MAKNSSKQEPAPPKKETKDKTPDTGGSYTYNETTNELIPNIKED